MQDRWRRYANERFLEGLDKLRLSPARMPRLEDINRFMQPLTGFKAQPVSGYVPSFVFFDCLRNREFPTTITIRDGASLDYLPEPDIFHDIAGHVPMHTDRAFARDAGPLRRLRRGGGAPRVGDRGRAREDAPPDQHHQGDGALLLVHRRVRADAIERAADGALKVYGSGLLSSFGEIAHAIDSPEVQRFPFQIEWVVNQSFEIDHYQPLLFIVDSFDHLFALVTELEQWMLAGKLDNVAPGEPEVSETDLASFLPR